VVLRTGVRGGASVTSAESYDNSFRIFAVSRFILAILALLVLLTRRWNREGLLIGALLGLSLEVYWHLVPPGVPMWLCAVLANASVGVGMTLLLLLATPLPLRQSRRVIFGSTALGLIIFATGFANIFLFYGLRLDDSTFHAIAPWIDRLRWFAMLVACAAIALAARRNLRESTEAIRPKALVLATSLAPLVVLTSAHALVVVSLGYDVVWARNFDAVGNVLTAIGLVYGALTGRLIDPEFYISTALAATLTSAFLTIATYADARYVVPRIEHYILPVFLEPFRDPVRSGVGIATDFAIFLCVGAVHGRSVKWTKDLVFHHREQHLRELREFGDQIIAREEVDVASALVDAAIEHAGAEHAKVYLHRDDKFTPVAAKETSLGPDVDASNPIVPALRRESLSADGSVSLPMPIGSELVGFLCCGRKRNNTKYAPDEITALALATREGGILLGAGSARSTHDRPPSSRDIGGTSQPLSHRATD
jgi:hypothetical protein